MLGIFVADWQRFDADPDPTFHFDADPDPDHDPDPDPSLRASVVYLDPVRSEIICWLGSGSDSGAVLESGSMLSSVTN